jgi:lipoate-protein ligase A
MKELIEALLDELKDSVANIEDDGDKIVAEESLEAITSQASEAGDDTAELKKVLASISEFKNTLVSEKYDEANANETSDLLDAVAALHLYTMPLDLRGSR